jgi:hypothetical protein
LPGSGERDRRCNRHGEACREKAGIDDRQTVASFSNPSRAASFLSQTERNIAAFPPPLPESGKRRPVDHNLRSGGTRGQ